MKTVLVTGASGFVGRHLCAYFDLKEVAYRKAVRSTAENSENTVEVGDIDSNTDWSGALERIDTVVHLAARVHVMRESADNPLNEFMKVNRDGTLNLARQAAANGVRRFIYLSTIKVHGEETKTRSFQPDDEPLPADPYSVSKLEAEKGLKEISRDTGMEYVIIRPPLVYGKGVGGNFSRLLTLVRKGWYLPFGMINNRRSMVGVENLCSLITLCLQHKGAANKTLLICDGEDVSTPDLIRYLAEACQCPARLAPVPSWLLHLCGTLFGKGEEIRRLTGNLQINSNPTRHLLDWQPPRSVQEGIRDSV